MQRKTKGWISWNIIGTLGASLLGNILAEKRAMRANKRTIGLGQNV